jgi:polyhydroxyalkanoate synthesis regulator phasin
MSVEIPSSISQVENIRVYNDLLLSQLKQHDEAITRLEVKFDTRMDEIRDKIQLLMSQQQASTSTLESRITKVETRIDNIDAKSNDGRWIISTILSGLALIITLIVNFYGKK